MNIPIKMNRDFEKAMSGLNEKYGEDFEFLNGFHETQLNFSDFIDGFVDKNVADVTIDANANASNKDIRSLLNEKGKSHDKMFAFNKIFYEMKKKYNLRTAREWLETEYSGGFYLHDAPTATYLPYCFSGDTKILTKNGIKCLDELVGENIEVLNRYHRWESATVKSFGRQRLRRLIIERYGTEKEIMVTGNHIWFVEGEDDKTFEVSTDNLKEGDRIPFNAAKPLMDIVPSPHGVAHGVLNGEGNELPGHLCLPPGLDMATNYLYSWLAGYFSADGSVDEEGRCTISSADRGRLEFTRDVLCVLRMPVNEIRCQDRVYTLALSSGYLKESFFIKPIHRDRFIPNQERRNGGWVVKSVEDTGVDDEVYCAVVEGSQSFTLDSNVLTHNCYAYDLTRLATEGLFFLNNYNNQPPKHLTTFMDDVIEYISYMSNRSSGAVGIPNVLVWSYYFWKRDCESGYVVKDADYYVRQCFQKFIYRLNQPFMRIDQTAFVNCSIFDRNYIESLFGGVKFPDGSYVVDQIEELIEHQKVFMEVVSQIRSENMFTFPVLTYSLLYRDEKFVDEDFARWCSDHNTVWNDSNFFISGDVNTLSNCCRLLSDTSKLNAFINSIGGTALSIGSVKVNTINLMRIALESGKDEQKYLALLEKRAALCCKALDVVRHIIRRNVEKGLLPNYQDGAIEMDKQYCTMGILGLYEVIEAFGYTSTDEFEYVSYTEKGIEFAAKIFETLNHVKDNFTDKYSFNIESVPAERAAVILCQKDNSLYDLNDRSIYSNQWIPLSEKCTIQEKLHLSSILDEKCSGGSIAHINLESNFPNTDMAWDMLNKIAQSGVIYFAFNTRINECKNHHGFVGTDRCPICGEGIYDTYQRIVGYLVPSRAYSKDRLSEFSVRQWYSYAEAMRE